MDRRLAFVGILAAALLSIGFLAIPLPPPQVQAEGPPVACAADEYGAVPTYKIRLLCIKHSRNAMADGDANLAIKAAQGAAGKGLQIKLIGNEHVDKRLVGCFHVVEDMPSFTEVLTQHIATDAAPGDTLIVFTIGHGFPNGGLQNVGQRKDVMAVMVQAAERYNQRILWWQLSCHASAGLPPISSLTPAQQDLFSIYASSDANQTSGAYIQGRIMEKVFTAMATGQIDTNNDGSVSADELRRFLDTTGSGKGSLYYAKSSDYVVFGLMYDPYLPVVDRQGPQRIYDRSYICVPGGR
jgi:hypothetical protein